MDSTQLAAVALAVGAVIGGLLASLVLVALRARDRARVEASLALPDGTGDAAYLDRLEDILPRLGEGGPWDIVFYNAGVDVHAEDRLGRLALTDAGLRARDSMVIGYFQRIGIPVCGVIGGGYSTDVAALAARHAILFEAASSHA